MLWHSAQTQLPGELLSSLTRKVGRVVVCTEPYTALAEACLIDREARVAAATVGARAGRSAGGTLGVPGAVRGAVRGGVRVGEAGVLLLVQPESLELVREILDAAELYAPGLQRWQYDRGATPKLKPISSNDLRANDVRALASGAQRQSSASMTGYFGGSPLAEPKPLPAVPAASHGATQPASPAAHMAHAARGGLQLSGASAPAQPQQQTINMPMVAISGPGLIGSTNGGTGTSMGGGSPRLRIAGTEARADEQNAAATRARPVLTEDELAMLLSDDPIVPPLPGFAGPASRHGNGAGGPDASGGGGTAGGNGGGW